jgi:beta-galactosidase
MRKLYLLFIAFLSLLSGCNIRQEKDGTVLFDSEWLFYRGDISDGQQINKDDSEWRSIELPHDWSIEDIPGSDSPFDSSVANGVSSGYTRGGIGWYRKHFRVDPEDSGKVFRLLFEGVYMNSDVWINGEHAGGHFYGYSSFPVDITPFLKYGRDNLIAVRVDNSSVKSRWYSGSGIYRHVWLTVSGGIHLDTWGIAITTPEISEEKAVIKITSAIRNRYVAKCPATVKVVLRDAKNNKIAAADQRVEVDANGSLDVTLTITVEKPELWSIDSPNLYQAEVSVIAEGTITDRAIQNFGIRKIEFDAMYGFRLNGKPVELKGGCIHHDNGPLGSCAYDRAEERKVELLKSAGFNAIRFAHNPPSPAILEACDRLGMLAIDESFDVWRYGHFDGDYGSRFDSLWKQDIENMVKRDRNHPSVIMWSVGNEIVNSHTQEIAEVCGLLADYVRTLDETRPVTSAANQISEQKDSYFSHLEICGYNYSPGSYEPDHLRKPERVMFGSESFAIETYDYWKNVVKFPYVIGDFVWTAFDHIGEASIGWRGYPQEPDFYPWKLAYCGDFDLTGHRRPQSFYRQTIWDTIPLIVMYVEAPEPSFPVNPSKAYWSLWDWPDVLESWNFEDYDGKLLNATVYTQCSEAEVFLNGKTLGKKQNLPENRNMLMWEVPYEAGKLSVSGYVDGVKITETALETAGKVEIIDMKADRTELKANAQDLSFIDVELKDAKGTVNPVDDRLIEFEVTGAGTLAAVASANPVSTESFQQPRRMTWRGRCMVIVKAGKIAGNIKIIARSENLPEKEIIIRVN